MRNLLNDNPEIDPIPKPITIVPSPQTNPVKPSLPEIVPEINKVEPLPVLPEIKPVIKPEINKP